MPLNHAGGQVGILKFAQTVRVWQLRCQYQKIHAGPWGDRKLLQLYLKSQPTMQCMTIQDLHVAYTKYCGWELMYVYYTCIIYIMYLHLP